MGWFDDEPAVATAAAAPAPAPAPATSTVVPEAPAPVSYAGTGGAPAAAQAAAYPQYGEDAMIEDAVATAQYAGGDAEMTSAYDAAVCDATTTTATATVDAAATVDTTGATDAALPDDLIGPGATPEDLGIGKDEIGPPTAEQAAAEPALTPEQQEERTKALTDKAARIADAQGVFSTDKAALMKEMKGLSPSEAAELEKIYGEKNKDVFGNPASLREDMKDEMDGENEAAFVDAALSGDKEAADEQSVKAAASIIAEENDAWFNTDEGQVNELLRMHGEDPAAAKKLSEEFAEQNPGQKLDDTVEANMNEEELKEAKANLAGDRAAANVAVIEQGDAERSEEVIADAAKTPGGLEKLAADTKDATGQPLDKVLAENGASTATQNEVADEVKASDKKATEEKDKRVADDLAKMTPEQKQASAEKAKEVASKLSTELSKTHLIGNNFDVTDQLRGLSPAEVEMVKAEYAKQSGGKAELEKDLREGLDGKDLEVAEAALSGDKVKTAAALVDQAADGIGTDTERWKKAMDTLGSEKERDEFKALMDKKHGGSGGSAYTEMVKSETSSFDRDELNAMGISNDAEREGQMAAVAVSKNAYGGKYATIIEGITDSVTDHLDVSEADRARGRAASREGYLMQLSNAGGDEDAQLDPVEKIAGDPAKMKAFEKAMKDANGKSAAETLHEELHDPLSDINIGDKPLVTDHRAQAATDLLAGKTTDAKAHRMLAHLDNYVNDNEDGATKMLESMKPEERAAVMKKADELAAKDGDVSATDKLKSELSDAQMAVADERIKHGKVDQITQLYEAGDTFAGLGKKTDVFYSSMQGKKPAEIREMKDKFEKAHPGENFEEWVKSKATSDGEKRDFNILLQGDYAKMTPEERKKEGITNEMLIQRMEDLNAAGRDGAEDREFDPIGNIKRDIGNDIGNYMGDNMSNAGDRMNDRMQVAQEMKAKLAAGQQLTPAEEAKLAENMEYMALDQKAFTETKTEVVNQAAEVVGTAVQVGTTALTGSDDAGEIAGGLAKMEVKGTLNSARNSIDEQIGDIADIAGSAIGSGVGGKFEHIPGASSIIEAGIGGIANTVGDTKNIADAGNMAESGIKNVSEGVATAVASEAIEGGFGKNKDGILSKATQAVTETAMTGDYSKGIGELAKDTAVSAVTDYATSKASNHHEQKTQEHVTRATDDARRTPTATSESGEVDVATPEQKQAREAAATQQAADAEAARRAEAKRVLEGLDAADQAPSSEGTPAVAPVAPALAAPVDIEGDGPMQGPVQSKFGKESTAFGTRGVSAPSEHGPVSAEVKGPNIGMTFPPGMDHAQKEAFARDAAQKLGLDASDEAINKALDGHDGTSPVQIEQTLHVKDAATTAETAKQILFSPEATAARGNDDAKGDCTVDSLKLQQHLAAQGIQAPIMDGKGHRYLVAGDQIMCPTFKQMGGDGPFVGTYEDMIKEYQSQHKDASREALEQRIESDFGIQKPGEDKQIRFAPDVKPFGLLNGTTALLPKSYDDIRRIMDEQAAAGIPPGQGIDPAKIEGAKNGMVGDFPKPTFMTNKTDFPREPTKMLPDGHEIPIDIFASPAPALSEGKPKIDAPASEIEPRDASRAEDFDMTPNGPMLVPPSLADMAKPFDPSGVPQGNPFDMTPTGPLLVPPTRVDMAKLFDLWNMSPNGPMLVPPDLAEMARKDREAERDRPEYDVDLSELDAKPEPSFYDKATDLAARFFGSQDGVAVEQHEMGKPVDPITTMWKGIGDVFTAGRGAAELLRPDANPEVVGGGFISGVKMVGGALAENYLGPGTRDIIDRGVDVAEQAIDYGHPGGKAAVGNVVLGARRFIGDIVYGPDRRGGSASPEVLERERTDASRRADQRREEMRREVAGDPEAAVEAEQILDRVRIDSGAAASDDPMLREVQKPLREGHVEGQGSDAESPVSSTRKEMLESLAEQIAELEAIQAEAQRAVRRL